MKTLFETLVVAFSMYSAIPMPQILWNPKNMRYALAVFPLVGAVIGAAQWMLWQISLKTDWFGPSLWGAIAALLPIVVTGGIHLDGFCDVSDALASHGDRERKLEIMKDSHIGAFGVIGLCSYFLFSFGLWTEVYRTSSPVTLGLIAWGYLFSRGLSACSVVCFPKAKNSGLLRAFSDQAHQRGVLLFGLGWTLLAAGGMVSLHPVRGIAAVGLGVLGVSWYFWKSRREFGGITGDTAGWFVTLLECWLLAGGLLTERMFG